ncbi:MAG: GHKL domain-containing protein [Lachnospiraceae bacterium]|nr:GHKL domain-containing protein [Lachnospiraceae bacterium]
MSFYSIVYLIAGLLLVLYAERFMGIFYENRKTSVSTMALTFSVVYIITIGRFLFLRYHAPDSNLFWLFTELGLGLLGYFLITLNYKSAVLKRIVVSMIACMIITFIHFSLSAVTLLIPNDTYHEVVLTILIVAVPTAAYLLASVLRRFTNIKKSVTLPKSTLITTMIPLFIFVLGIIFLPFVIGFRLNLRPEVQAIALSTFTVGFTFLTFHLYDLLIGKHEQQLHSHEKEYYALQYTLMQESIQQIKSIRHDMNLHLTAIKNYAIQDQTADIPAYIDRLVTGITHSEIHSNTGNLALDSIINYKLRDVKKDKIDLDLKIEIPSQIGMETSDLVIIMGNLLDNALTAVAKVKEKKISIHIRFQCGNLFINVENSFNGEVLYSNESHGTHKHIVTSKKSDNHGFGLHNIRNAIKKYNGHMNVTHNETIFKAGVFLYVDEE